MNKSWKIICKKLKLVQFGLRPTSDVRSNNLYMIDNFIEIIENHIP